MKLFLSGEHAPTFTSTSTHITLACKTLLYIPQSTAMMLIVMAMLMELPPHMSRSVGSILLQQPLVTAQSLMLQAAWSLVLQLIE